MNIMSSERKQLELIAADAIRRMSENKEIYHIADYFSNRCIAEKILLSKAAKELTNWIDSLPKLDENTAYNIAKLIAALVTITCHQLEKSDLSKETTQIKKDDIAGILFAVKRPDVNNLLPQVINITSKRPVEDLIWLLKYSNLPTTQLAVLNLLRSSPDIGTIENSETIISLLDKVNIQILPELLQLAAELDKASALSYMVDIYEKYSSNERITSAIINSLVGADSLAELELLRKIAFERADYIRELALDHLSIGLLNKQELLHRFFSLENVRDCIDLLDMFLWNPESEIAFYEVTNVKAFARMAEDFPEFMEDVDTLKAWGKEKGRIALSVLTELHKWKSGDTDGVMAVNIFTKVSNNLQDTEFFGFSSTMLELASSMQPYERLKAYISLAPFYENPDEQKKLIDALVDLIESADNNFISGMAEDSPRIKQRLNQIANELGDTNQGDILRTFITSFSHDSNFQFIQNPYVAGKPIVDPKMFVGRGKIFNKIESNFFGVKTNNIVLLYGERRIGKTSILKQIQNRFTDRSFSIFIDMQGLYPGVESMKTEDEFFNSISAEACRELSNRKIKTESLLKDKPKSELYPWFRNNFIPSVQEKIGKRSLLLMLDEFGLVLESIGKKKLPIDLLSHLRHLMQHIKDLDFILAGTSDLLELAQNQTSILFNLAIPMKVSFLDRDSSVKLITDPVRLYNMEYDPEVIDDIIEKTGGHPYLTQFVCHEMVDLHNQKKKSRISLEFLQEISEQIMDQCAQHFKFLWNQASKEERALLSYLTISDDPFPPGEIERGIISNNPEISEQKVMNAIDSLIAKDLIIGSKGEGYKLAVGLMRIWLNEQKS